MEIFYRSSSTNNENTIYNGLTPSAASDEPQVVELGDLVFDQGGTVAQLGRTVLVVAGFERDGRAVRHLGQYDHLERAGQRLVGPPVRGQGAAQHVRTPGADQLAGVFGGHLVDGRLGPPEVLGRRRRRRGRRGGRRAVLVRRRAPAPFLAVVRRHPYQAHSPAAAGVVLRPTAMARPSRFRDRPGTIFGGKLLH